MIRVRAIKIKYEKDKNSEIIKKISHKLNVSPNDIKFYKVNKKSFDTRKKDNLHYVPCGKYEWDCGEIFSKLWDNRSSAK